jgi:hypothetical protein
VPGWRRAGLPHNDTTGLAADDRVDESLRLERRQVVGALTQPDQLDRDAELALDVPAGGAQAYLTMTRPG